MRVVESLLHFSLFAGVVKLVDALDSKSSGPCVRVGSIPTSGTIKNQPNFNNLSTGDANLASPFYFYNFVVFCAILPFLRQENGKVPPIAPWNWANRPNVKVILMWPEISTQPEMSLTAGVIRTIIPISNISHPHISFGAFP